MGYIEDNLLNNEKIIVRGVMHRAPIYLQALIGVGAVLVTGLMVLLAVTDAFGIAIVFWIAAIFGVLFSGGAIVGTVQVIIYYYTAEFAVTDRRIIVKSGWIRRQTSEFPLKQVESLSFGQTVFDRMIGAAHVQIKGSGSSWFSTALLANYREFRNAAAEQMERIHGGPSSDGPTIQTVSAD